MPENFIKMCMEKLLKHRRLVSFNAAACKTKYLRIYYIYKLHSCIINPNAYFKCKKT